MSSAGAQANKFYEEVSRNQALWFAQNENGIALEFDLQDGKVSFPLWSSKARILKLKKMNPELFESCSPREISWTSFKEILVDFPNESLVVTILAKYMS